MRHILYIYKYKYMFKSDMSGTRALYKNKY